VKATTGNDSHPAFAGRTFAAEHRVVLTD
jgi:hypothetical protein